MVLRRTRTAVLFVLGFLSIGQRGHAWQIVGAAAGRVQPGDSVGKPPTDAECNAVADAIGKAALAGDAAGIDRMIDWGVINERTVTGINAPEQFRKNFLAGLDSSRLQGKGVSNTLADTVQKGGSYTLLRRHAKEGRPWLLFRLLLPEAGVNYHDLQLARRPDGKVKVVDIYVYLSGELLSQTFRRAYIQAAAQGSGSMLGRLTGADRKFAANFSKLAEMATASREGRFGEALGIYKDLAPEIKKEKSALLLRLVAAQNVGDDGEYQGSIEAFRKEYPGEACIDVMSIDYYLLKKQYRECLDCVDRLDLALQGDPFLQTMRSIVHVEQNDLAAARADLKKAIDAEPGLVAAYWNLVAVSLKDSNFDETLKTLRTIRDKFRVEFGDLSGEPFYKDFAASPQFKDWLKDKPTADAKGSAEKPKD